MLGVPAHHQQPAIEVVAQRPQRVAQKLQATLTRRFLQSRVEHEAGEHLVAAGRGQQCGVVPNPQIAAKPQQRGHYRLLRLSRQMWVDNTVANAHQAG